MSTHVARPRSVSAGGFANAAAAVVTVAVIASASALAAGSGFGTMTWKKTRLPMVDAYAYQAPDTFDKAKKATYVVLTTVKLDRGAIDTALDRGSEIDSQVREAKGTVIELRFGADGGLRGLNAQIRTKDGFQSFSTSGGTLGSELKTNTATRIAGRVNSGGTQTFSGDKYSYDFVFDVPITPAPPPGERLPAGGGAAGKAYVAFVAAMQKGDVDAIARFWPKDRAEAFLAARKDPDFRQQLEMVKVLSPKTVTVKGGTIRNDVADLDVVGKDADGNVVDGKVRMVRDGKTWRVQQENLTTHTK